MNKTQIITRAVHSEKVQSVKRFFDEPDSYLPKRQLDIRLRRETVRDLTEAREFVDVIDVGCGDGSISLQLLNFQRRLTLLDVSANMLGIARSRIPEQLSRNVSFVNRDFRTISFEPGSFDIVICLGVLAHIDHPSQALAQMASILRPDGILILEWTDSYHFVGRITRYYNAAAALIRRPGYQVNLLSTAQVMAMTRCSGLVSIDEYRYALPLPKTGWMFSSSEIYRVTRAVFGTTKRKRCSWLGNQHIHSFRRVEAR